MYLDSEANRSVIQEQSPIRQHLSKVSATSGSCNVRNGAKLKYLERGIITQNNEVIVVKYLKYVLRQVSRQVQWKEQVTDVE